MQRTRRFLELVKATSRIGLFKIVRGHSKEPRYTIKPVKAYPLRTDLDCTAEVIVEVEGDDYK